MHRWPPGRASVVLGPPTSGSQLSDADAPASVTASGNVRRRPGEVFRDCAECPEMVVLPGGNALSPRRTRPPSAVPHLLTTPFATVSLSPPPLLWGDRERRRDAGGPRACASSAGRYEVTVGGVPGRTSQDLRQSSGAPATVIRTSPCGSPPGSASAGSVPRPQACSKSTRSPLESHESAQSGSFRTASGAKVS